MSYRDAVQPYVNHTVSEGTMLIDDLIPKFVATAKELLALVTDDDKAAGIPVNGADAESLRLSVLDIELRYQLALKEEDSDYFLAGDVGGEDVDELFTILDQLAPAGCTFGAHDGDGALYGFWKGEDDVEYEATLASA